MTKLDYTGLVSDKTQENIEKLREAVQGTVERPAMAENILSDEEHVQCNIVNRAYDIVQDQLRVMDYKAYLLTDHWSHFRSEALKNAGDKCQVCGCTDKQLHVHHNTYENRGRETFNDVVVLCCDCHKKFHGRA